MEGLLISIFYACFKVLILLDYNMYVYDYYYKPSLLKLKKFWFYWICVCWNWLTAYGVGRSAGWFTPCKLQINIFCTYVFKAFEYYINRFSFLVSVLILDAPYWNLRIGLNLGRKEKMCTCVMLWYKTLIKLHTCI